MAGNVNAKPVFEIRAGVLDDCAALGALALRSKAYWGYDRDFIDRCVDELSVDARDITDRTVLVAALEQAPLGFGVMRTDPGSMAELTHLFIDPAHIGKGVGRALVDALTHRAATDGFDCMTVASDPYAQPFYERMGFVFMDREPSKSIPGRTLPRLEMRLGPTGSHP